LKRRTKEESLPGDWDLPGGAVEAENNAKAFDERIVGQELAREVMEEVGIGIAPEPGPMPAMFPAVVKGGNDWAFVIALGFFDKPTKGETKFVSPQELKELAEGPLGNRLVSGLGKRMWRLSLQAFLHSPKREYREQANQWLQWLPEIHSN
jgi:8-oxo-dGTP pyrophosphatase MutT (NUDIX family)